MALNDLNKNAISFKKIVGKTHTNQNFAYNEESTSSNLQVSYSTIFASDIDPTPQTNGLIALYDNDGVVEFLQFQIVIIPDTQIGTNQSQGYEIRLPSDYSTYGALRNIYGSNEPLRTSLGKLQIVPPLYGALQPDGTTEYDLELQDTTQTTIPKFSTIDWIVDNYAGVLFVQSPPVGFDILPGRPAFVEGFLYIGDYLDIRLSGLTTGSTTGATTLAANLGSGAPIYAGRTGNTIYFKTINTGPGISLVQSSDNITISAIPVSGGTGSTSYTFIDGKNAKASSNFSISADTTYVKYDVLEYFTGNSYTTVVTVGGLGAGANLSGRTLNNILESILIPTLNPTLTAPSNGFAQNLAIIQEVGASVNIIFTATFNRGSINPQYSSASTFRSGLPTKYVYSGSGLPSQFNSTSLNDVQNVNTYVVLAGTNSWNAAVAYSAGVQPKNSAGGNFGSPLASGQTGFASTSFSGIYPYFYGKVNAPGAPGAGRPTANQALINSGTKVIASAAASIAMTFNSTANDYIWFAVPATAPTKTTWFINSLNNGAIGGAVSPAGNLFPTFATATINSPTALWSGISYEIYISNYQTSVVVPMTIS